MFYDQFENLCQKTGDKPYSLAIQLGAKRNSIVDQWKKGSVPRQPMLQKIAEHFGVSIDYLLTGEKKQPDVPDELSKKEKALLTAFRSLSPVQQEFVLQMLSALPPAAAAADSPGSDG